MSNNARPDGWPWQDPVYPYSCPYIPERKIPRNGGAFTGRIPSAKNNRLVGWEGLTEQRFYRVLETVPTVWRYLEQPCRIPFVAETGLESRYTPDVLIFFHPPTDDAWRFPPLLVEVKPLEILRTWWQDHQAKLTSALAFAWDQGWDFRVITDIEIDAGKSDLIQRLEGCEPQPAISRARLPLLSLIDRWGELPWEELRGRMPAFSENEISKATTELINEGVLDLKTWRAPFLIRRLRWPLQTTPNPFHTRPK